MGVCWVAMLDMMGSFKCVVSIVSKRCTRVGGGPVYVFSSLHPQPVLWNEFGGVTSLSILWKFLEH